MVDEKRLYAQFTLDSADSHKIAPLSDAAFRAWFRMVIWSRRMLTDGRVPASMAKVIAKPRVLTELCSNDPTSPSLRRDEAGDYWLHDFLEHQPSRAQVEARQATNRANAAAGGRAKAKRLASESLATGQRMASESVLDTYTETKTETETQEASLLAPAGDAKPRPRKPERPLPEGWKPSTKHYELALERGVDVRAEAVAFRNHAETVDRRARDWDAAFRTWLGKAKPTVQVPVVEPGFEWMQR